MTSCLPLAPLPGDDRKREVDIAYGGEAARVRRDVATKICAIRFPGETGVEGQRLDSGEWVDLVAPRLAERMPALVEPDGELDLR